MSNSKIYNVIGIMSGTSMDGIDLSLIKTDGKNYNQIIFANYLLCSYFAKDLIFEVSIEL